MTSTHQKQCRQAAMPDVCLCEPHHKAGRPEDCPANECFVCSFEQCPFQCVLHYHHDGCPACAVAEEFDKHDSSERSK